jgi:Na+/proline symporter
VAACLDVAAVLGFVALGRSSHAEGETLGGIAVVAAPFLVGTAIGWLAVRRTRRPAGMRAGAIVWACTAGIGLLLRGLAFERPTPVAFVLVASVFLALMLFGWRALWGLAARRRERSTTGGAPSAT